MLIYKNLDKILEKEVEDTEPINNVFTLAMKKIESDLVSAGIIDNLADVADNERKKSKLQKMIS